MDIETAMTVLALHPEFYITIAILFGLLIGSFLNVVAYRLPQGGSIISPPSHCPSCKHRLSPLDLVPVFSYLALRGKCRHCKTKVSPMYAFGEAITAAVFGFTAWQFGFTLELLVALLLVSLLIAAAISDLLYMIIPNRLMLFGILAGFAFRLFIHPLPLWNYMAAFILGGGILYGIAWLSEALLKKEGMGGGDIKLFAMAGLFLGIGKTLLAIFLSCAFGAVIGLFLILIRKQQRDQPLPFGPFIALGVYAAYVWGDAIIRWYGSLLG